MTAVSPRLKNPYNICIDFGCMDFGPVDFGPNINIKATMTGAERVPFR